MWFAEYSTNLSMWQWQLIKMDSRETLFTRPTAGLPPSGRECDFVSTEDRMSLATAAA
jgi:hypothetical protein